MLQVVPRSVALARRPWPLAVGVLIAGGGCALTSLPLFGVPGYELGEAVAIAVGVLGGVVGGSAAFQERRLIQGRDPRPRGALRRDDSLFSAFLACSAAFIFLSAFALVPLLFAAVRTLVATPCSPWMHAGFYPLLVFPSAALASAAGALCGFASSRGRVAAGLYLLLLSASAVHTLWPVFAGPQIYAFNLFAGYLPGPLYDEALSVDPALWWFRLYSLGFAALLVLVTGLCLDMNRGQLSAPQFRTGSLVLLGLTLAGLWTLEERAPELGFRATEAYLRERLGGHLETQHFLLTYPRGKSPEEVERMGRDLEFRHAQLSSFLGGAPAEKIRVFVYRSPEEKRRLVGAEYTQFAKPWLAQLHLNDAPFPHPTLKHELAHVMASRFGSGPFRVTSHFGFWPVMGIIEGLAVAADNPVDEMTLHQWAAGMRREKLAPDVRKVLSPEGFYRQAPAQAYTSVGSFLRYLADTYGPEKLTALYAHGDFQAAYGRTLSALAEEWERMLDALPLDAAVQSQAFARFRQPSLFVRNCAREVASKQAEAGRALRSDPEAALELYRGCAELQPDEPAFALGTANALLRLSRAGEAATVLGALEGRHQGRPALAAQAALARADVAYARGKKAEAATFVQSALTLHAGEALDRAARIRLEALALPHTGPAIWSYFRAGHEELRMLQLKEALEAEPQSGLASYLLGRNLLTAAPGLSLRYLSHALAHDLPQEVHREALRLAQRAAFLSGDCDGVRQRAGELPEVGPAARAESAEWVARCDFEDRTFHGALVPAEAFR